MKIDGGIQDKMVGAGERAQALEAAGYDGVWSAEMSHNPFFPLLLAAEQTRRVQLGTGIAVAFARSPMTMAVTANDLQRHSNGRFVLGLGSQIKPHITRRFSMPWSRPAARMREYVSALHAIWDAWEEGSRLNFRGDFYEHTLMTPMFDPGPNPAGRPKVFVAGVGPKMTAVAGEVADGFSAHGFTTPEYFRAVTLPALEEGLERGGRGRADIEISMPVMIAAGKDGAEQTSERIARMRKQLAFYSSTPAYRPVLDHHGWGDLQPELNAMSKRGEWDAMTHLISDEVLDRFVIRCRPEDLAAAVDERYGGVLDRLQFFAPIDEDPDTWLPVIEAVRAVRSGHPSGTTA